jgi:hypothetical protein
MWPRGRREGDYDERERESDLVSASTVRRALPLARPRQLIADTALPVATAATLMAIAGSDGGYFPTTWGWSAFALAWAAALALIIRSRPIIRRLELVFAGAFAAYVGWVALSITWTRNQSQTVSEVQRDLVYPLGLLALALLARQQAVARLLGSILVATTAIAAYALTTRLFPDRVGDFADSAQTISAYRLEIPIGYWNALGLFAVLGILIAFGFIAHGRSSVSRGAAAAAVVVLASSLYFTFSRGAWLVLAVGTSVLLVLDTRRLRLITSLALATPPAILPLLLASRADGLTRSGATVADATRDGHSLAPWILALAAGSFSAAAALAFAEQRIRPSRAVRGAYAAALFAAGLAGSSLTVSGAWATGAT